MAPNKNSKFFFHAFKSRAMTTIVYDNDLGVDVGEWLTGVMWVWLYERVFGPSFRCDVGLVKIMNAL